MGGGLRKVSLSRQKRGCVLFQPSLMMAALRVELIDEIPEIPAVIKVFQVPQFMDDDTVPHRLRHQDQPPAQHDAPF